MPRYVAFLRGVMPTNCKMAALKRSFEAAGFTDVSTVLGSGNVVFCARSATESALEKKAEAAMGKDWTHLLHDRAPSGHAARAARHRPVRGVPPCV